MAIRGRDATLQRLYLVLLRIPRRGRRCNVASSPRIANPSEYQKEEEKHQNYSERAQGKLRCVRHDVQRSRTEEAAEKGTVEGGSGGNI